jgi:hypothetical protein
MSQRRIISQHQCKSKLFIETRLESLETTTATTAIAKR